MARSMSNLVLTDDAFLGGKVMICQPKSGYRAGIDAVFLAAVVPHGTCRVLDLGAGVGTVGLCLAARCDGASVTLLERDPILAELAHANIERSGWAERVRVVQASVGSTAAELTAHDLKADSFDHVLANPPYHAEGRGTAAPDALKAISHAMPEAGLDDWMRFMARMAKPGGTATIIHKAGALPEILAAFAGRFGDLRVLPLYPREGEPAGRVIVQGIKGSRAAMVLMPGFVLHDAGDGFTLAAQAVLRQGAGVSIR